MLYMRDISGENNWRRWKWTEMSRAFVDRFQNEYKIGPRLAFHSPSDSATLRASHSVEPDRAATSTNPYQVGKAEPRSNDSSIQFESPPPPARVKDEPSI